MCDYCGAVDGCIPVGGKFADCPDLTADDWRKVYNFTKYVYLPFIHGIIMNARRRAKKQGKGVQQ